MLYFVRVTVLCYCLHNFYLKIPNQYNKTFENTPVLKTYFYFAFPYTFKCNFIQVKKKWVQAFKVTIVINILSHSFSSLQNCSNLL